MVDMLDLVVGIVEFLVVLGDSLGMVGYLLL